MDRLIHVKAIQSGRDVAPASRNEPCFIRLAGGPGRNAIEHFINAIQDLPVTMEQLGEGARLEMRKLIGNLDNISAAFSDQPPVERCATL